jgi:beta-glucuronidase
MDHHGRVVMALISKFLILSQVAFAIALSAQTDASRSIQKIWHFRYLDKDSIFDFKKVKSDIERDSLVSPPHSFNLNEKLGNHRAGFARYSQWLELPKNLQNRKAYFVSDGIALRCRVFIDSLLIGEHRYAWTPFSMDVTRCLKSGERHLISIVVDNRLLEKDIPDRKCDGWWVYGGMIRNAYMEFRKPDGLDRVFLKTFHVNGDIFDLSTNFETRGTVDSVVLSIKNGKKTFFTGALKISDSVSRSIRMANIHSWSPEDPFLYDFIFTPYSRGNGMDSVMIRRGFAQLTTRGNKLLLNGNSIYLRGIARHDVIASRGPLLTRQECLNDLLDIKELGANFMRIAHFPQNDIVYKLADSLGIIVMEEIPAWKTAAEFLSSEQGKALASSYIREVIKNHGQHTCIGIWSIGNEFNTLRSDVASYVKYMTESIKKFDESRPVTYCSYFYQFDKAYGYADIISINEYFGWYLGSISLLSPMLQKVHSEWPEKPMIIAEFGAQAALGLRNPAAKLAGTLISPFNKDLSEDHQALYLRSHIDTIWKNNTICNGMVVWLYNDFNAPCEKPHSMDMPLGLNGMGIVDGDRRRKKAFDVVKAKYHEIQNASNGKPQ